MNDKKDPLNVREKIVLTIVIFLIQMIHPWEYSHQYKDFWEQLKKLRDEE